MSNLADDTTPRSPDPEPGRGDETSPQEGGTAIAFACDAMLKGLARWLRAYGYDASWSYGIEDGALVAQARQQRRILLTCDGGLMRRRPIRRGELRALHLPHDLDVGGQLRQVIRTFSLERRPPTCMRCGGRLEVVPKASVASEAPPRTFRWLDEFTRCRRCHRLFWKGTHWRRIEATVKRLLEGD